MKLEPSTPHQVGCFTGAVFLGGLVAVVLIPPARRVAIEIGCGNPMLSALVGVFFSLTWGAMLGGVAGHARGAGAGSLIGGIAAILAAAVFAYFDASASTIACVLIAHLVCGLICGVLGGRQPGPRVEEQGTQT